MYGYEKWQPVLVILELYLLFGADLLIVPIVSILHDLFIVLNAYKQSNSKQIRVWPGIRIPTFVSRANFSKYFESAKTFIFIAKSQL